MEIKWTDTDPETGEKRYIKVEKFSRKWTFHQKIERRSTWVRVETVGRDLWETLLDAIERRYQRREGITEEDVKAVQKILAEMITEEETE